MPSILTSLELLKSVYDSLKGGVDVEFVLLIAAALVLVVMTLLTVLVKLALLV